MLLLFEPTCFSSSHTQYSRWAENRKSSIPFTNEGTLSLLGKSGMNGQRSRPLRVNLEQSFSKKLLTFCHQFYLKKKIKSEVKIYIFLIKHSNNFPIYNFFLSLKIKRIFAHIIKTTNFKTIYLF